MFDLLWPNLENNSSLNRSYNITEVMPNCHTALCIDMCKILDENIVVVCDLNESQRNEV